MNMSFGRRVTVTLEGCSHGETVGVTVGGLPAGEAVEPAALQAFLRRRQPGQNAFSSARLEPDEPQFLTGLNNNILTGEPLHAVIPNRDAHTADYDMLRHTPRPGHADYTAWLQTGAIPVGGGAFSGRMTAPLCVAGGIALQLLQRRGIAVGAHLLSVGEVEDEPFPLMPDEILFEKIAGRRLPVCRKEAAEKMEKAIDAARREGDSLGGVIECAAVGLPAGLGETRFDGIPNRLAAALFGIPAVKGVEFGSGFAGAHTRGSENNDPFYYENGKVRTRTNHAGGVLGGISTGMPLVVRVAVKPTPSILREQETVDLTTGAPAVITVQGRHDACIAPRAVPVVEAVTALVLLDMLEEQNGAE